MSRRHKEILLQGAAAPDLKVGVALASHDQVPIMFAFDLANLCAFSTAMLLDSGSVTFGTSLVAGTYIHAARQELMEELTKEQVTHALWVDTDMRFPKNALLRLLSHNEML